MANRGCHYYIAGQVQGVFYRANAQRKATQLGLTGWVRNLTDGRVEVLAFGSDEQLDALTAWLWEGPPSANVILIRCHRNAISKI